MRFVIDEDLPRSTGVSLKEKGHQIEDIRDCGLRGVSDEQVFLFAKSKSAILVTGDLGFGNILHYPLGQHPGIIIVHFPNEIPIQEVNRQLLHHISHLSEETIKGHLIIIEPGRLRIRRKKKDD